MVFHIAAVTKPQHHDSDLILPFDEKLGQIKFSGKPAVLRITNPPPVAPEIKGTIDTIKNNTNCFFCLPLFRHCKVSQITSRWIFIRRDWGRTWKRILHVGVDRLVITLQLPVTRHLNITKTGLRCVRRLVPAISDVHRACKQFELPLTVKTEDRIARSIQLRILFRSPACQGRVAVKPILRGDFWRLPRLLFFEVHSPSLLNSIKPMIRSG